MCVCAYVCSNFRFRFCWSTFSTSITAPPSAPKTLIFFIFAKLFRTNWWDYGAWWICCLSCWSNSHQFAIKKDEMCKTRELCALGVFQVWSSCPGVLSRLRNSIIHTVCCTTSRTLRSSSWRWCHWDRETSASLRSDKCATPGSRFRCRRTLRRVGGRRTRSSSSGSSSTLANFVECFSCCFVSPGSSWPASLVADSCCCAMSEDFVGWSTRSPECRRGRCHCEAQSSSHRRRRRRRHRASLASSATPCATTCPSSSCCCYCYWLSLTKNAKTKEKN